jgi:hypothetical protein
MIIGGSRSQSARGSRSVDTGENDVGDRYCERGIARTEVASHAAPEFGREIGIRSRALRPRAREG